MRKIKASSLVFCFFVFVLLPIKALSQVDKDQHADHFFFAVSAMASPAQTLVHFAEFRDYLEEKLSNFSDYRLRIQALAANSRPG